MSKGEYTTGQIIRNIQMEVDWHESHKGFDLHKEFMEGFRTGLKHCQLLFAKADEKNNDSRPLARYFNGVDRMSERTQSVYEAYNVLVDRLGREPTYEEVAIEVGSGSRSAVFYHIKKLKEHNLLEEKR